MTTGSFMTRLKHYYSKEKEPQPIISIQVAVFLSILCTVLYVVPLYISKGARPSPTLSRDAPSVIKARVRAVMASCFASSVGAVLLIVYSGQGSLLEALRLLGWWPVGFLEIGKAVFLTALLFLGPLFEQGIAEGAWKDWINGHRLNESLRSWVGWRNFVAGPITEEVVFRSIIIPLHLMANMSPTKVVFLTPLYFGIAHINHFYEFKLVHPYTPYGAAIVRSIFQFSYTTVFGWYATFLYLRTGSLPAVILAHSFCNYCGLPRLWGRVERNTPIESTLLRGKEDEELAPPHPTLGHAWTVAYYLVLVAGAVLFSYQLWPLTESPKALVSFTSAP
ncbi:hypothetical protein FQN57_006361 [Myotisia sp. PD_48]|nr:hypothetical protein FQN57_006361 [Myotisia sp. PD_48]